MGREEKEERWPHLQEAGDQLAEGVGVGVHQPLLHLRILDERAAASRAATMSAASIERSLQ